MKTLSMVLLSFFLLGATALATQSGRISKDLAIVKACDQAVVYHSSDFKLSAVTSIDTKDTGENYEVTLHYPIEDGVCHATFWVTYEGQRDTCRCQAEPPAACACSNVMCEIATPYTNAQSGP